MKSKLVAIALLVASAGVSASAAQPGAADSPFGTESRVEGSDLSQITGQADVAMEVRAQNTATVSHNSVSGNSNTGAISFDSASFQAMSGLSLLSANTGNNVSINSSLNVNVSIQPQ